MRAEALVERGPEAAVGETAVSGERGALDVPHATHVERQGHPAGLLSPAHRDVVEPLERHEGAKGATDVGDVEWSAHAGVDQRRQRRIVEDLAG